MLSRSVRFRPSARRSYVKRASRRLPSVTGDMCTWPRPARRRLDPVPDPAAAAVTAVTPAPIPLRPVSRSAPPGPYHRTVGIFPI